MDIGGGYVVAVLDPSGRFHVGDAVQLSVRPEALRVNPAGAEQRDLGGGILALMQHPEQMERLRTADTQQLRTALEEILRWILSWAGQVQIQRPNELKDLFVQTLKTAIHQQSGFDDH